MADRKKLAIGLVIAGTVAVIGAVVAAGAKKPKPSPPSMPPPPMPIIMLPPQAPPAPVPTPPSALSGTIVEVVLDASTKQPVANAIVVSNTGDSQVTTGNGQAVFSSVEGGSSNYLFAASASGYYGNGYTQGGKAIAGTLGTTIYLRPIPAYVLQVVQNTPQSPTGYYLLRANNGADAFEFAFGPFVPPTLQDIEHGLATAADVADFWAGKGYSVWLAPATAPTDPNQAPIFWNITPTSSFVQVYNAGPYPEPFTIVTTSPPIPPSLVTTLPPPPPPPTLPPLPSPSPIGPRQIF